MSNRATAETLYEAIKQATITERQIHTEALRDLILLSQREYLNAGGEDLPGSVIDENFEIKVPLIDFSSFLERVKALSVAFTDEVISRFDYQSALPGIDPVKTDEAIKKEQLSDANNILLRGDKDGGTDESGIAEED
jgi:hypothetical protein